MAYPPYDDALRLPHYHRDQALQDAVPVLLAAAAHGPGVTEQAARDEAMACLERHSAEAINVTSAARVVAEMRAWAAAQAPKRQIGEMNLRVEWSGDDGAWAAVLIRDGEPWFLDGALVGMETTPAGAVEDLLGIARHLVLEGSNFLMQDQPPLSAEDRRWLFNLTDVGVSDDLAYRAVRNAEREAGQ